MSRLPALVTLVAATSASAATATAPPPRANVAPVIAVAIPRACGPPAAIAPTSSRARRGRAPSTPTPSPPPAGECPPVARVPAAPSSTASSTSSAPSRVRRGVSEPLDELSESPIAEDAPLPSLHVREERREATHAQMNDARLAPVRRGASRVFAIGGDVHRRLVHGVRKTHALLTPRPRARHLETRTLA